MHKIAVLACVLLTGLAALPAAAAPASPGTLSVEASAVTRHEVSIRGKAIPYTADVERTRIKDGSGQDAASIVTISYLRRDTKSPAGRPVIFLFNGGPGASSSPLHTALGPERVIERDGKRVWTSNAYSPLDAADLVFIDPVGTGYSRPLPGHDGKAFWSVAGDAAAVASVIRNWLKVHHREGSPYFICGESYGTNRAAELSQAKYGLSPAGIILISLYADPKNADIDALSYLPSFAAIAAYHGRNAVAADPRAAYDEAAIFARTVYLPALVQGSALPAAEKRRVAEEMAKRIGLSADFIEKKDLRLDPYDQMLNILKDKGLRTGQSDARVTGEISVYAQKKQPYDDPALGGAIDKPSSAEMIGNYLTGDLKYRTGETYVTLNMKVNGAWDFDRADGKPAFENPVGLIGATMAKNARLRLFWVGGLFDLRTPVAGGIYALTHAGIDDARITAVTMASGHGVYEGDDNLKRFTAALCDFVAQTK